MCELGCEIVVMDEIRALSQVTEVNRVYGSSYDMIVKINRYNRYKILLAASNIKFHVFPILFNNNPFL
jgi:hypothetical protein